MASRGLFRLCLVWFLLAISTSSIRVSFAEESASNAESSSSSNRPPSRLVFGSCHSQHYESVLWENVAHRDAAAFVWTGDAIYADDFVEGKTRQATPAVLKQLYDQLLLEKSYEQIELPVVLGVWDDHDYGTNNGDRRYQYKRESAQLFVQFLEQSSKTTNNNGSSSDTFSILKERAATGKGVYGVKVFDFHRPAGQELLTDAEAGLEPPYSQQQQQPQPLSDRSVAVFLLDCRSHKTPWNAGLPDALRLNYEADFLGDEQWRWFETALRRSTATVNVVVQGLQVSADRFWNANKCEAWSRFPMAQHRLYQSILQSGAAAPVLVTGDVHMAELLRRDCRKANDDSTTTRSILEFSTTIELLG